MHSYLWGESGYFDNSADTKPLLHLWSLAIEEQFYIVWPLLLGLVWKRKINFLTLTLFIAMSSFAFNIFIVSSNPIASFYSPLSRFWELMVGGILAYLTLHRPQYLPQRPNWQSTLGLILLTAGILLINREYAFPGWWALLPTVGAFLVVSAGHGAWLNRNLLSNRVLVWIGLISYPLYLWHWPLLSFTHVIENRVPSKEVRIALVGVSFLLAWLTYALIEKKIRHSRKKLTVVLLSILMIFSATIGLVISQQTWKPRNSGASLEKVINAAGDWEYPRGFQTVEMNGQTFYLKKSINEEYILFYGDSHIEQYGPRIIELANRSILNKSVYFATSGGCPPIPNVFEDSHIDCEVRRAEAIKFASDPKITSVTIGACWNCYFTEQTNTLIRLGMTYDYFFLDNGKKVYLRQSNGRKLALASLEVMLKRLSATKIVYLILDNPCGKLFDPKTYFEGSRLGLEGISVEEMITQTPFDKEQQVLRNELIEIANRAGAIVIDPIPTLCPNNNCMVLTNDGIPLYKDGNHLRPFFVRDFADYIDIAVESTGN